MPYTSLPSTDRYILARFAALADECTAAYQGFQFYRAYQALQVSLGGWGWGAWAWGGGGRLVEVGGWSRDLNRWEVRQNMSP